MVYFAVPSIHLELEPKAVPSGKGVVELETPSSGSVLVQVWKLLEYTGLFVADSLLTRVASYVTTANMSVSINIP